MHRYRRYWARSTVQSWLGCWSCTGSHLHDVIFCSVSVPLVVVAMNDPSDESHWTVWMLRWNISVSWTCGWTFLLEKLLVPMVVRQLIYSSDSDGPVPLPSIVRQPNRYHFPLSQIIGTERTITKEKK